MDICVYSDESGVFDKKHNDYFVFGGILFLSKDDRDICARKYSKAEHDVKTALKLGNLEAKASIIPNEQKGKLFRSLNNEYKFAVVVKQQNVLDRIFQSKKDKQRYLDYVYKIMIKRCFENLIRLNIINPNERHNIYFFVDEHATATNGRYELRESLEQELKLGTYNQTWNKYYEPIFSNADSITLDFCNSSTKTLIRAADIIANKVFYYAQHEPDKCSTSDEKMFIIYQP